jgi:glyoxylase-like metal-dependent hydrolase (beta-lactamase superfamily II)
MKLTDHVYHVGCGAWNGTKSLSRNGGCNVFAVDGGSELALIDAGFPEGLSDVINNIRSDGLDPAKLKKVFVTHAHSDHVDALADLLSKFDVTIYAHELTRETLSGRDGIYTPETKFKIVPAPVHETVSQDDMISVGSLRFTVVDLPGHTPDGLGFVFDHPSGRACFTGDTAIGDQPLDNGETAKGVIGWIDARWKSNLSHHAASLQKLRDLKLSAFFGGHGESHLNAADVQKSLDNCVWRLELLRSIPHLNTMTPVQI